MTEFLVWAWFTTALVALIFGLGVWLVLRQHTRKPTPEEAKQAGERYAAAIEWAADDEGEFHGVTVTVVRKIGTLGRFVMIRFPDGHEMPVDVRALSHRVPASARRGLAA